MILFSITQKSSGKDFYTLRFQDEETEADKFLNKFPEGCEYDEDIDIIVKWIELIGEKGALERYFRPESKRDDNIWAIPIETTSLRLYIIRLSDNNHSWKWRTKNNRNLQ